MQSIKDCIFYIKLSLKFLIYLLYEKITKTELTIQNMILNTIIIVLFCVKVLLENPKAKNIRVAIKLNKLKPNLDIELLNPINP